LIKNSKILVQSLQLSTNSLRIEHSELSVNNSIFTRSSGFINLGGLSYTGASSFCDEKQKLEDVSYGDYKSIYDRSSLDISKFIGSGLRNPNPQSFRQNCSAGKLFTH
jgi:hypothetical protein